MKGTFDITKRFQCIEEIADKHSVDLIECDKLKIWNLIRILLFFYDSGKTNKLRLRQLLSLIYDGFLFSFYSKKSKILGFSSTESRILFEDALFDIYLDPLYDVFGSDLHIFEWPSESATRKKAKVYSKNYVPIFIPVLSSVSVDLALYKIIKKHPRIDSEDVLKDVILIYSKFLKCSYNKLKRDIYFSIVVFNSMRKFFVKFLNKTSTQAVFIRCGYGQFHMALAQACRSCNIPSIELQHGIISKHHAGYVKNCSKGNMDCHPEYLLTYGLEFEKIAKNGNLFKSENVTTVGFPYIEERIERTKEIENDILKKFISKNKRNILVSSQWAEAEKILDFTIKLSQLLKEKNESIGVLFKPHPRDVNKYNMDKYNNIFLVEKSEDIYKIFKVIDIHTTAWSTTGIEALLFGKPNIYLELGGTNIKNIIDIVDDQTTFAVDSVEEYYKTLKKIIVDYDTISKKSKQKSTLFFKPNAKKNIKNFMSRLYYD
jgi:hypothetical protein